MTFATLGIDIESAPLRDGVANLDSIVAASQRAERAAGTMSAAVSQSFQSIKQSTEGVQQRIDAMFKSSNLGRDRAQDIKAYGDELDRLRARFNPLFAVSQKYEQELLDIAKAEKLGAITAVEAANARKRAADSLVQIDAALGKASAGLGRFGPQIQNVSYQVADFATQVASGGSAATALAQQLPQAVGSLGIWGAVAGAALAIGVPLVANLFDLGQKSETLADKMDDLADAVDDYRSKSESARGSMADLVSEYGRFAESIREVLKEQEALAKFDAEQSLAKNIQAIQEQFGTLNDTLTRTDYDRGITPLIKIIGNVREDLGLTDEQAKVFTRTLLDLGKSGSTADLVGALNAAREQIIEMSGGMAEIERRAKEGDDQAKNLVQSLGDAAINAAQIVGNVDGAASSLSAATAQADALAGRIRDAANAAASLNSSQALELKLSKIKLDYSSDPVGAAIEEAKARFEDRVGDISGFDPVLRDALQGERDEYVKTAQQIAANRKELDALNESRRKSERTGRKTISTEARELERQAKAYEKVVEGIQAEIDAVGQSEVGKRVSAELRKTDVDAISEQGQAISRLVIELSALEEAQARVDAANKYAADSFSSFVMSSLGGIKEMRAEIANLAADIGSKLVRSAATDLFAGFGNTALGSVLGGILTPSAKGNVFSGGEVVPFAKGGIVDRPSYFPMRRGTGLAGEAGPEAIIPLKRGPNGDLGIASSGGGSPSFTFAPVIDARGADAGQIAALNAKLESMNREWRETFRANVMSTIGDRRMMGSI